MASLGQAWVQGRKNAQEAAKSQIATLLDLAKNASETDRTLEYFSPEQKAARDLDKAEMKMKTEKRIQWNKLAPNLMANPEEAGKLLDVTMPTLGKWVVERSANEPNKFIAREIFTDTQGIQSQGRVQEFGSKNELIHTLGAQYLQTPMEAFKSAESLYSKEVENKEKRATKLFEAQADYEYGKKQQIAATREGNQLQKEATLGAANITGKWGATREQIGLGLKGKEYEPLAKEVAARTLKGFVQKDPSGAETAFISMLNPATGKEELVNTNTNPDAAAKHAALTNSLLAAGMQGPGKGLNPPEAMLQEATRLSEIELQQAIKEQTKGLNIGGRFSRAPGSMSDKIGGLPTVQNRATFDALRESADTGLNLVAP